MSSLPYSWMWWDPGQPEELQVALQFGHWECVLPARGYFSLSVDFVCYSPGTAGV